MLCYSYHEIRNVTDLNTFSARTYVSKFKYLLYIHQTYLYYHCRTQWLFSQMTDYIKLRNIHTDTYLSYAHDEFLTNLIAIDLYTS